MNSSHDVDWEDLHHLEGRERSLVGLDEVGRGPLAGPVVACGICLDLHGGRELPNSWQRLGVTDSKQLSERRRRDILSALGIAVDSLRGGVSYSISSKGPPCSFALAEVDRQLIDQINIARASLLAIGRCLGPLNPPTPCLLLVDGPWPLPELPAGGEGYRQLPLVGGDSRALLIALASIIAKQYRDHLMRQFSLRYPEYGFESHFGYPTRHHRQALARFGPCPIHRRSFRGVEGGGAEVGQR